MDNRFVKVDDKGFEYMGQNLGRMNGIKQLHLDLRRSGFHIGYQITIALVVPK